MGHRSSLVLNIEKNDSAFHQVCNVDMHEWLALRSENRSFSFRTNTSLRITKKLSMDFIMDMVSIGKKLVILFNHIGRERQAGIAGIGKRSAGGHASHRPNVPDYYGVSKAYSDSARGVASFNALPGLNRIDPHG